MPSHSCRLRVGAANGRGVGRHAKAHWPRTREYKATRNAKGGYGLGERTPLSGAPEATTSKTAKSSHARKFKRAGVQLGIQNDGAISGGHPL